MWNAKRDFLNMRQQKYQTVQDYYERFVALREVNEALGNNVHYDLGFVEAIARENGEDKDALSEDQKNKYMDQGIERMTAMHFLMGADRDRYGSAIEDFESAYLMDRKNRYPKTLHDAYTLLKGWKKNSTMKQHPMKLGVSFYTVGDGDEEETALVNHGGKYNGPPCSRCGRSNHPVDKCIAKRHEDDTVLHVEHA